MTEADVTSEGMVADSEALMDFCESREWPQTYALGVIAITLLAIWEVGGATEEEFQEYLEIARQSFARHRRTQ